MPVQPPNIDPVPQPPIQRGDRTTFSSRVDAFILWLVNAVTQFAALASNVYNNALEAVQAAVSASTSAQTAMSAASDAVALINVSPWVSGTTYAKNTAVISQINFQTYRRRVAGAGTTDPANDPTNWAILTGDGAFIPQVVTASSINLALGNYFTRTMTGNQTFTFDNCPSPGFSFTLELTVTAGIVTLPTSVRTPDSVPYTLTAGKVHELMFVTSNSGARWRLAAATNYEI